MLAASEGVFLYEILGPETQARGEARFGDLLFCPPGHVLRRRAVTLPLAFHFVEFAVCELEREWLPTGKARVTDTTRLASTFAYGFRLGENAAQAGTAHLVRDLIFLAVQEQDRRERAVNDPLIESATAILEAAMEKQELSLAQVAQRVHLSPVQFTRRFQAAKGVTPSAYLSQLRLARAECLLRETRESLDVIAAACGYRDGFYLSRVFLKKRGLRPSVFRRQSLV